MATMPRHEHKPFISPRSIDSLFADLSKFDPETAAKEYPWADRFVMGLPLAPWQRDFKWSEEQCKRFIGSVWSGVHLGAYLVTEADYRPNTPTFQGVEYLPLTNMVIDGQQRLKAIELYVTDKIATPDVDGKLLLWSEVEPREKRRFENTIFSRGEIRDIDEMRLRAYYDVLNFGGVAHEKRDRALDAEGKPRKVRP
jgi:hypothetical protein